VLALGASLLLAGSAGARSSVPFPLHTDYSDGQIVAVPDDIPHADGAMVDDRILPDLRYIADRWPIYVVEGYAGYLPGYGQVGCRTCHVADSDHYRGLATDIVPLHWDGAGCDRSWKRITRLALWAEPRQNYPRAPFRWVGYNGDVDHGCGNHLHLSWSYAPTKKFHIADWVQVFDPPTTSGDGAGSPRRAAPPVAPVHEGS